MIWSLSQSTGFSIEDILYKWSFESVLLFSRATPSYDTEYKEESTCKKRKWIEALDMNNPANIRINPNSENEDEEYIV